MFEACVIFYGGMCALFMVAAALLPFADRSINEANGDDSEGKQ